MKQAIKRIGVYLLLGFVMSWVVAWSCSLIPHRYNLDLKFINFINLAWAGKYPVEPGGTVAFTSEGFGVFECQTYYENPDFDSINWFAIRPSAILKDYNHFPIDIRFIDSQTLIRFTYTAIKPFPQIYPEAQFPVSDTHYSVIMYGFPIPSHIVTGAVSKFRKNSDGSSLHEVHGALSQPTPYPRTNGNYPLAHSVYLPYAPLWRGLLYNTLFYALIFFILTSTKRAYRHARRLRKGKCPICNYDLQYDNTLGCPECGWRKA